MELERQRKHPEGDEFGGKIYNLVERWLMEIGNKSNSMNKG